MLNPKLIQASKKLGFYAAEVLAVSAIVYGASTAYWAHVCKGKNAEIAELKASQAALSEQVGTLTAQNKALNRLLIVNAARITQACRENIPTLRYFLDMGWTFTTVEDYEGHGPSYIITIEGGLPVIGKLDSDTGKDVQAIETIQDVLNLKGNSEDIEPLEPTSEPLEPANP